MRVITPREEKLKRVVCDNCNSELEYTKEDIKYGDYGVPYVKCPVCEEEIDLWEEDSVIITADKVKFPQYFSHVNSKNAVMIDDETVNRDIRECINTMREDSSVSMFIESGDTMVVVFKMDGDCEYEIFVAKDYYELPVEFESEDYE